MSRKRTQSFPKVKYLFPKFQVVKTEILISSRQNTTWYFCYYRSIPEGKQCGSYYLIFVSLFSPWHLWMKCLPAKNKIDTKKRNGTKDENNSTKEKKQHSQQMLWDENSTESTWERCIKISNLADLYVLNFSFHLDNKTDNTWLSYCTSGNVYWQY